MKGAELWTPAGEVEAIEAAAGLILDAFREAAGDFAVGLSGGRVAPGLFRELVRRSRTDRVALGEADFFWCDERCVPADHEDSNYRVARVALLEPLGVSAEKVHRLVGELPPEQGAILAREEWRCWQAGRVGRGKAPELDCAVLGVGEDGHVASLFPENVAEDDAARDSFRAVRGSKPPPDRLTLGYRELREAGRVVVLAVGGGKESVVRGSLSGALDTPLARVLKGRGGRATWVVWAFGGSGAKKGS